MLRQAQAERDPLKLTEAVKRVITYMTIGIDVSGLFPDMLMACSFSDISLKKLVYLYLVTYAEVNSEIAILAINTLRKDCQDMDPSIRGLALRSLTSLRLPSVQEYLESAVREGLRDPNGYVRKTAVMGVAKLQACEDEHPDLITTLHDMLMRDTDMEVVANCCTVLSRFHVLFASRTYPKDSVVARLYASLPRMQEWGLFRVLSVLPKPESEDKLFDSMNILETLMKGGNAAVLLEISKLFLSWTFCDCRVDGCERCALHLDVVSRVANPLLTIYLTANTSEIAFSILKHIHAMILAGHPMFFTPLISDFYPGFSDPEYLKIAKIRLVADLACLVKIHSDEVLEELNELIADGGPVGVAAVKAVSKILISGEPDATCASVDQDLIGHSSPKSSSFEEKRRLTQGSEALGIFLSTLSAPPCISVASEILCALATLNRKFILPQSIIDSACMRAMALKGLEDSGTAALLSLLPACDAALGILSSITDHWKESMINGSDLSSDVKLGLIACSLRHFFARPVETGEILKSVLSVSLSESDPDVREQSEIACRLLVNGMGAEVVAIDGVSGEFSDRANPDPRGLYGNFNGIGVF